jgi:hypothetical protein
VTPLVPLPDPLPQPAPPVLVWALLQLTFLLHVLAMNVVLGGSLLALYWRFSRRGADAAPRARLLAAFDKALPVALAATVTFGVAPLLFVQVLHGRVFFTSSILMGWYWLGLVPLVIAGYYGAYRRAFRGDAPGRAGAWVEAGVAVAFAAAAFVQVTNATRALRPDTFAAIYAAEPRGASLNLGDPSFWPRYLHLLLGAVAVAALGLALFGATRRRADPELARWAVRRGRALFAAATAANLFAGLLFLIALPKPVLIRLVGGDTWSMTLLAVGIVLAVALAGAAVLALGARNPFAGHAALAALLLVTLASMLLLRDGVRLLVLRQAGLDVPSRVVPQWGPFAVFVVCLLAAAATIAWMVRALARGKAALAGEEVL